MQKPTLQDEFRRRRRRSASFESVIRALLVLLHDTSAAHDPVSERCRGVVDELARLGDRVRHKRLAKRLHRAAERLTCDVLRHVDSTGHVGGVCNGVSLAPRHARVLQRLLTGESEKEIARKLGLTRHTVHEYVKVIYKRLDVGSRAELIASLLGGGDRPYSGTPRIRNSGNEILG